MNLSDLRRGSFRGVLSPAQCAEGINLVRENAQRLIEDARVLFLAGRYPSAAQQAILAIEESGKEAILRLLAAAETREQARACWRDFCDHSKKNIRWAATMIADLGHGFREMLASTQDEQLIKAIERFKQLAIYVDCLDQGTWTAPVQFVERDAAADLIDRAQRLSSTLPPATEREIEIAARHTRLLDRAEAAGAPQEERQRIYMRGQAELCENGFPGVTGATLELLLANALDLKGIGRTQRAPAAGPPLRNRGTHG